MSSYWQWPTNPNNDVSEHFAFSHSSLQKVRAWKQLDRNIGLHISQLAAPSVAENIEDSICLISISFYL